MRSGVSYQPKDLLPVVRTFPAGHEKAGQHMRWRGRCAGCDRMLGYIDDHPKLSRETAVDEVHDFAVYTAQPLVQRRELTQVEASPGWLALLTKGQRDAFYAAFPKLRFPVECAYHAHQSLDRETSSAVEAPPAMVGVGTALRPTAMTEDQAFGA